MISYTYPIISVATKIQYKTFEFFDLLSRKLLVTFISLDNVEVRGQRSYIAGLLLLFLVVMCIPKRSISKTRSNLLPIVNQCIICLIIVSKRSLKFHSLYQASRAKNYCLPDSWPSSLWLTNNTVCIEVTKKFLNLLELKQSVYFVQIFLQDFPFQYSASNDNERLIFYRVNLKFLIFSTNTICLFFFLMSQLTSKFMIL